MRGIEKHRLGELILLDLKIYWKGSIGEIHERIGKEISRKTLQDTLKRMVLAGEIGKSGGNQDDLFRRRR